MNRPLAILACLSLAACNTVPTEPKIVTKEVKVEVTVPCVSGDLNLDPKFPDTDEALKAAPGAGDMLQLLGAGRLLRIQTLKEWAAAMKACR